MLHCAYTAQPVLYIGVPVMVHLGGGKTKFARILGSRP